MNRTSQIHEFDINVTSNVRETHVRDFEIKVVPPGTFWRYPRKTIVQDFDIEVQSLFNMSERRSVMKDFNIIVSGGRGHKQSVAQVFDIIVHGGRGRKQSIVREFNN